MLHMKRLRMNLKNQRKKPLKGTRRHKMFPREEVQLHQKLPSTLKRNQQKQKVQNQKKSKRNLVVKQKVLRKRLIVIHRHQKWLQGLAVD